MLLDAFDTAISGSTFVPQFVELFLAHRVASAGATVVKSRIQLFNYKIHLNFKSSLTIQNTTLAADPNPTEDTVTANDDEDNQLTVNPLRCRKYEIKGWKNAFIPKSRSQATVATWTGFVVNPTYGTFENSATDLGNRQYQKPPYGTEFQDTLSVGFTLEPGEMRTNKCSFNVTMKLQHIMERLKHYLVDRTENPLVNFGTVAMVACEHKLKNELDADVVVSYEHNFKLDMASKYKNSYSAPLIYVDGVDK